MSVRERELSAKLSDNINLELPSFSRKKNHQKKIAHTKENLLLTPPYTIRSDFPVLQHHVYGHIAGENMRRKWTETNRLSETVRNEFWQKQ